MNSEPVKRGFRLREARLGKQDGEAVSPASNALGERLHDWFGQLWQLSALPLLLLFALPILLLLTRAAPAELWKSLQQQAVHQALGVSLRTSLTSLVVILLFGTPLAFWMGRREFRFKKLVDTLIDLPTVLPPSVAGVALLLAFGRRGALGAWLSDLGVEVAFTTTAVILAQIFIAAPFYVRAAALGFNSIDHELEQAAQLDGASRLQILRFILLPLARFSLISGAMMSWARALGEFGATIIFAGNFPGRTQTMPTAIYLGFEVDLGVALTLSIILLAISFLSLLIIKVLVSRRMD